MLLQLLCSPCGIHPDKVLVFVIQVSKYTPLLLQLKNGAII
jgi:hypothetical protein